MPNRKYCSPTEAWVGDPEIAKLVRHKAAQISRLRGFSRSDQPDIEQELFLDLLQKVTRYDPARASRRTYASRVLKNKAASMLRAVRARKRACQHGTVSLNDTIHDRDGRAMERVDTIDGTVARRHTGQRRRDEFELAELRLDVAEANRPLSPDLRNVAAVLSHASEYATAQVLGISRRQTAGRVDTLREHYEERGLCE